MSVPKPPLRIAISLLIVTLWVVVGVLAPWLAPHNPYRGDLLNSLLPPFWNGGDRAYPLGTDFLGHDILSQMIMGARLTLVVATGSLLIGGTTGTLVGLVAGYYGGGVDNLLMRLADLTFAFPLLLVALLLALVFGASFTMVVAIIGLLLWSRFARLVRSEVLSLRTRDFVALARVAGASDLRIMLVHLLPNVIGTVLVIVTLQVGQAILTEAALSFLGVGIPPPNPSWGAMISEGRNYLDSAWWISVFPGLAILLVVLALSLLGDWLRDVFDPRLQQA